jgi:arylsulfatase
MGIWAELFTVPRLPKFFDLRADPYGRADITSNTYYDWFISNAGIMYGVLAGTQQFLDTFKDYPPRQRASTFSIDQAVEKLKASLGGS